MATATHAPLDAKERNKLPKGKFAHVDKDGKGHLPLEDADHVRDALDRFDQTHFESEDAKKKARAKILAAAKKFGVDVSKTDKVEHCEDDMATHAVVLGEEAGDAGTTGETQQADPNVIGAPEWIMLIPAGTFEGRDGRGPYTMTDPQAVIDATKALGFEAGLPIDENHATDFAAPQGGASPAMGWIRDLDIRDGALWGRIEWTEKGQKAVQAKEYRYISPVFKHREGTITTLLRAGLTNNPNLFDTAICSQKPAVVANDAADGDADDAQAEEHGAECECGKCAEKAKAAMECAEKAKAAMAEFLKGDSGSTLIEAAHSIKATSALIGLDFVEVCDAAQDGTVVQKVYALMLEAAKTQGLSIAHYLDALMDMAEGQPETPAKVDEDDMPGAHDQMKAYESKAATMKDSSAKGNFDFANDLTKHAAEFDAAGKAELAARCRNLASEARARGKAINQQSNQAQRSATKEGKEIMSLKNMTPEALETMAARAEEAGHDDDAKALRAEANEKRETIKREADEKAAQAAASQVNPQLEALTKQMATLTDIVTANAKKETHASAAALVDAAIREGRVMPAERDVQIELCMSNPDQFKKMVEARPVLVRKGAGKFETAQTVVVNGVSLSPSEVESCRNLNVKPEDFVARKKTTDAQFLMTIGADGVKNAA